MKVKKPHEIMRSLNLKKQRQKYQLSLGASKTVGTKQPESSSAYDNNPYVDTVQAPATE